MFWLFYLLTLTLLWICVYIYKYSFLSRIKFNSRSNLQYLAKEIKQNHQYRDTFYLPTHDHVFLESTFECVLFKSTNIGHNDQDLSTFVDIGYSDQGLSIFIEEIEYICRNSPPAS